MSGSIIPSVCGISSADIAVPEHERELHFYSQVLSSGENPLWRRDLMNNLGMPVIGLGPRSNKYSKLPLQWMPHFPVTDVSSCVQRALDLGGTETLHAKDKSGSSQWAVLIDTDGAAFGIIPASSVEEISEQRAERQGRISWLDLTVPDAPTTRDFYQHVMEWTVQNVDMENEDHRYVDYNMINDKGSPVARVCHARGVKSDLPPIWMIYLPVSDLVESVRRVRSEGGTIINAIQRIDGEITSVVVQDLVGAYFILLQE